jgi:hypothetical protein
VLRLPCLRRPQESACPVNDPKQCECAGLRERVRVLERHRSSWRDQAFIVRDALRQVLEKPTEANRRWALELLERWPEG